MGEFGVPQVFFDDHTYRIYRLPVNFDDRERLQNQTSHFIREHHEVLTEENRCRCDPIILDYHVKITHYQRRIHVP